VRPIQVIAVQLVTLCSSFNLSLFAVLPLCAFLSDNHGSVIRQYAAMVNLVDQSAGAGIPRGFSGLLRMIGPDSRFV
jgi:hypothetical protein